MSDVLTTPPPAAFAPEAPPAILTTPAAPTGKEWIPEAYRAEPAFQNFKDVNDLATSYLSASKMVGMDKGRLAVIPKDDTDANGWNDVYEKLGRPKTAEEYGIKGDAASAPLWDAATKVFHEAGLSQKQAAAMHGFVQQVEQGQAAMFSEKPNEALAMVMPKVAEALSSPAFADRTLAQLKGEWGQAFDERIHSANRALATFAAEDKDIAVMFRSAEKGGIGLVNLPGMVKLMAAIGGRIAEPAGLAGVGGGSVGRMSPNEAATALSQMSADKAFFERLQNKDPEAVARWNAAQAAQVGA